MKNFNLILRQYGYKAPEFVICGGFHNASDWRNSVLNKEKIAL